MTSNDTVEFICEKCGFKNTYTRAEVQRKGKQEIYRDLKIVRYSVPCKNPKSPACPQRRIINIVEEKD